MAGTIPKKNIDQRIEFYILRAAYYNQSLPRRVFSMLSSWEITARISAMVEAGLLVRRRDVTSLTASGAAYLVEICGGRPPMIDDLEEALLPEGRQRRYVIEVSVARAISRRVSGDE